MAFARFNSVDFLFYGDLWRSEIVRQRIGQARGSYVSTDSSPYFTRVNGTCATFIDSPAPGGYDVHTVFVNGEGSL